MSLNNKVALITGAGNLKGMGRGVVQSLAKNGADIVIHHLGHVEQAAQVADEVRALGRKALLIEADLAVKSDIDKLFDDTVRVFGRLDILVNNAGLCVWERLLDITPEGYQAIVDVNLKGTFECSRRAARLMLAQGDGGRIVNIASVQARRPTPVMAVYSATKAGIDHLSQSMALQLAPHRITVNQIWPGFVDTDINGVKPELATEQGRRKLLATIPLGQAATPTSLGDAIAYLCSEAADVVTGAVLKVDSGAFIRCLQ